MKKKFLYNILILVTLIILFFTTVNYAETSGCVLRSSRCGLKKEVEEMMSIAKMTYEFHKYPTFSVTDPALLVVLSNAVGANVQLYFCHGDQTLITFEEGGLTTKSSGTIPIVFPGTNEKKYLDFYSTSIVNWSNKKLVTLATCYSAGKDEFSRESIAHQIAELGSQMVVGWTSQFSSLSGPDWLNTYHDKLTKGATVLEAMEEANKKFYVYGNVKNSHLSYNSITSISQENKLLSATTDIVKKEENNNILSEKEKGKFKESQVENIIKSNDINFNIDNYEKRVLDGLYICDVATGIVQKEESYIDYVYKIGDFITDSAYTVVLDKDNNIKEINDYTKEIPTTISINSNNTDGFSISDEVSNFYLNKAKSNIEKKDDIEKEEIIFYYDIEKNKRYAYVDIVLNNSYTTDNLHYEYEIQENNI